MSLNPLHFAPNWLRIEKETFRAKLRKCECKVATLEYAIYCECHSQTITTFLQLNIFFTLTKSSNEKKKLIRFSDLQSTNYITSHTDIDNKDKITTLQMVIILVVICKCVFCSFACMAICYRLVDDKITNWIMNNHTHIPNQYNIKQYNMQLLYKYIYMCSLYAPVN